MGRKRSGWYIKSDELYNEWHKWKDSHEEVEKRVISSKLGIMLMDIADHLLQHHNFNRYPQHMKDEMKSDAIMKQLKNLKNIKEQYASSKTNAIFSYLTACCWSAYIDYLANHYKQQNLRKKLMVEQMEDMQATNPLLNQDMIRNLQKELDQYETTNEEED